MQCMYLTADSVGGPGGGSTVTYHELLALQTLAGTENVTLIQPEDAYARDNPFYQDDNILRQVKELYKSGSTFDLAHGYAGCLSKTIIFLQEQGCKVTYTAAAHSVEESRWEHEHLGLGFDYPHLTDPEQWHRYLAGYLAADQLIVPSTHSGQVMKGYGAKNFIVIPHGCGEALPPLKSFPERFTVGYLGAIGPDKGVCYLLQAWKELNYKDATLTIAGTHSTSTPMYRLLDHFGGGSIQLLGWVDNVSDFYYDISLYTQCSVSEGFGMEVLEAMHHGRPVLCSIGAGAHDLVPDLWKFPPRDVKELAAKIDVSRRAIQGKDTSWAKLWQDKALPYTWNIIRQKYQKTWEELLCQKT